MKAAQLTPVSKPARITNSFFSKESGQDFFHGSTAGSSLNEQRFFSKSRNNNYGIQTKLTVGAPNDIYEKEADAMADKVVQRMAQPEAMTKRDPAVETKPASPFFTPFIQKRCAHCEQEEKLQKKQNENETEKLLNGKLQKKPIFESNAEPTDDNSLSLGDGKSEAVQRKCAECEQEDKLQKKSDASSQTISSNIESYLSSSKGSGTFLPKSTRSQMENSFGTDFSSVKIHNDSSAIQMSKTLNAQAFTHGNDIYFNEGKFNTNSPTGKHLLAHELTHTMQQGSVASSQIRKKDIKNENPSSSGVPNIQRSWYNFDIPGTDYQFDPSLEGVKTAAGLATDTVTDVASGVVEWIATEAGKAAISLANAIVSRFGGIIIMVEGGGIELIIPKINIIGRYSKVFPWSGSTKEKVIAQTVVEVPYIGPVFLTLFGKGQASASISAGIGPTNLEDIVVRIDPGNDLYEGTASLTSLIDLTGNLTLAGILGVLANPSCIQEVIRIEGGLSISGTGGLETELKDTVNVKYERGKFNFDNTLALNNCVIFNFDLNALANLSLFQHNILSGQWNLFSYPFEKCWPIVLMGDVFTGGGGSSGGGGASGDFGDDADKGLPAKLVPTVNDTKSLPNSAQLQTGSGNKPAFSADSILNNLFDNSIQSFTPDSIHLDPPEIKQLADECPVQPQDPCADAPTGLTPSDPIPIIWLKNPLSELYDTPIFLIHLGKTFSYSLFTPKLLPDNSESIGIEPQFMPFVGKPLGMRPFGRGSGSELRRFKARLTRFGYDFSRKGRGVDADHFQDDFWRGPNVFGNYWPLDFRANSSAGTRQNQLQEVKWADFIGGPVYLSCIGDKDLRNRYFVISQIVNPEADIKTRACDNKEKIC